VLVVNLNLNIRVIIGHGAGSLAGTVNRSRGQRVRKAYDATDSEVRRAAARRERSPRHGTELDGY
jgi:hypothetical protein